MTLCHSDLGVLLDADPSGNLAVVELRDLEWLMRCGAWSCCLCFKCIHASVLTCVPAHSSFVCVNIENSMSGMIDAWLLPDVCRAPCANRVAAQAHASPVNDV